VGRKTPIRHNVKATLRRGKPVRTFERGTGQFAKSHNPHSSGYAPPQMTTLNLSVGQEKRLRSLFKLLDRPNTDVHSSNELMLWGDNDSDLYTQRFEPIVKNQLLKMKKGVYDSRASLLLWKNYADDVAKSHIKAVGRDSDFNFTPSVRAHMARNMRDRFERDVKDGAFE